MTQPTVLLVVLLEQRWKIQKIKKVAYHEVGTIVGSVLENHEVEKITNSAWWSKRSYGLP
jgi:hypothetical protein